MTATRRASPTKPLNYMPKFTLKNNRDFFGEPLPKTFDTRSEAEAAADKYADLLARSCYKDRRCKCEEHVAEICRPETGGDWENRLFRAACDWCVANYDEDEFVVDTEGDTAYLPFAELTAFIRLTLDIVELDASTLFSAYTAANRVYESLRSAAAALDTNAKAREAAYYKGARTDAEWQALEEARAAADYAEREADAACKLSGEAYAEWQAALAALEALKAA